MFAIRKDAFPLQEDQAVRALMHNTNMFDPGMHMSIPPYGMLFLSKDARLDIARL